MDLTGKKRPKVSFALPQYRNDSESEYSIDDLEPIGKKNKAKRMIEDQEISESDQSISDVEVVEDKEFKTKRKRESNNNESSSENEMEPFSMKRDLHGFETGFVENIDEYEHHDTWLQGISQQDIQKAADAHFARKSQVSIDYSEPDLLKKILCFLNPMESITQCMLRLNKLIVRKKWGKKHMDQVEPQESINAKKQIENVTEVANILLNYRSSIYDETYEDILDYLRDNGFIQRDWNPNKQ